MLGIGVRVGRLELHQCRSTVDLVVGCGQQPPDSPGERCRHGGFHLHALDDGDGIAGGNLGAGADGQRDDDARHRRPHDALIVAAEAMRRAVDLDEVLTTLHR